MPEEFASRMDETTRDEREWVPVCSEGDHVTARLVCTYLEAENIEARIEARNARFLVQVPAESYDAAMRIYGNEDMGGDEVEAPTAALQEVSHPTSVKTARRMREALAQRGIAVQGLQGKATAKIKPGRLSAGKLALVFLITLLAAAAIVYALMMITGRR
ncbi:MAG: hypothetical protein IT462_11795 [Planctomycetes bacterium]|nr:hypothetical protein [Planctomycetota bacterium]